MISFAAPMRRSVTITALSLLLLEGAQRALTALEDAARRSSVPPGWLRER